MMRQELSRILAFTYAMTLLLVTTWAQAEPQAPSLNPPHETLPAVPGIGSSITVRSDTPSIEWVWHRTLDNKHPNGTEQEMLWLMNRARHYPHAEGVWLATSREYDIAHGRDYYGVDLTKLQAEFDSYAPSPPAAFDARLYEAAYQHSLDLIQREAQDHSGQRQRIKEAGFSFFHVRGNVFSYARNALHAHAAFNIDWGPSPDGMQEGRGHRKAIMALDGDYTNVGLAAVPENSSWTSVGPLVVTGNYAEADTSKPDHFNRFLVGTVWRDENGNGRYDAGEGLPDVSVLPSQGTYYAITSTGGGYAIPVDSGTFGVTFSGGSINTEYQTLVTIEETSVLLDYQPTTDVPFVCNDDNPLKELRDRTFDSDATIDSTCGIYTIGQVEVLPETQLTLNSPRIWLTPGFSVRAGGGFSAISQ